MENFIDFGQIGNIIGKGVQAYNWTNNHVIVDTTRIQAERMYSTVVNDLEKPDKKGFLWSIDTFGTHKNKVIE